MSSPFIGTSSLYLSSSYSHMSSVVGSNPSPASVDIIPGYVSIPLERLKYLEYLEKNISTIVNVAAKMRTS